MRASESRAVPLDARERALADRLIVIRAHLASLERAAAEASGGSEIAEAAAKARSWLGGVRSRWLWGQRCERAGALAYALQSLRTIGELPGVAWCLAAAARLDSEAARRASEELAILLDAKPWRH